RSVSVIGSLPTGTSPLSLHDALPILVAHREPLAVADLATMRLGPIRPRLEAVVAERGATLLVPLIDRGALVGLVEADHVLALRRSEEHSLNSSHDQISYAVFCLKKKK